jgi:hypothetical protein
MMNKKDGTPGAVVEVQVAGRARPTFSKRQKEQARKEKQRMKAERKLQRKLEKAGPGGTEEPGVPVSGTEELSVS